MSSVVLAAFLSSVSSLSLALVVIFDRLMVADCYRDKPNQAWMVSSVLGATFGLLATLLAWLGLAVADGSFATLARAAGELWLSRGWLMVVSGALAIQVARHYFRLFVPEHDGQQVNETAIAMWLASTPIFVFVAVAALQSTSLNRGLLAGLDDANVSWSYGFLVTVTVLALLRFEAVDGGDKPGFSAERYTQIALMLATTVVYTIILSAVLRPETTDLEGAVVLLPLYWIGFAAGGRVLLRRQERIAFRRNWRRMKRFAVPILVAEIFGMSVFFAEFFALGNADPTLVNLIISAHVLLVFLMARRLAALRQTMESNGVRRIWFLGIRLTRRRLPEKSQLMTGQVAWLGIAFVGLAATVYITK